MRILRQRIFSTESLASKVEAKLDREKIDDYDISDRIPKDNISISSDLGDLKIYIPEDYEYSQYEIDDFIRGMLPYARTSTKLDRDIFIMTLTHKLNEEQYYRLIKYIIEDHDYCTIIEE